jgi:hypothetical protein
LNSLALSLAVAEIGAKCLEPTIGTSASETASESLKTVTKNYQALNRIALEKPIKSAIFSTTERENQPNTAIVKLR